MAVQRINPASLEQSPYYSQATLVPPGASMLYIVLVAGVMIVAMKLVIAFAKKKMEADLQAAKEKSGAKAQDDDSQAID